MCSRIILSSLIFGFCSVSLGQQDEPAEVSVVRTTVEKEVAQLEAELQLKKNQDRFALIQKTEKKIKQIRSKQGRQQPQDEIFMDSLESSLSEIPRGKKFEKAKCKDYSASIRDLYSPGSGTELEEKPDASVQPALNILKLLCQ